MSAGPYEWGNIVIETATFAGDPTAVFFSYIIVGTTVSVVDPGFGQPGTKITKTGTGVYVYTFDTSTLPTPGTVSWRFWSTGTNQAAAVGQFTVKSRPF